MNAEARELRQQLDMKITESQVADRLIGLLNDEIAALKVRTEYPALKGLMIGSIVGMAFGAGLATGLLT